MVDRILICHACGNEYAFAPRFTACDTCAGPLDVEIDIRTALKQTEPRAIEAPGGGIAKFAPFFAVGEPENFVILGEGSTPLLRHSRLNALLGLPNLLIKNEAGNPTWAFKDRLNAVNASLAREFGYRDLVALSTGNHGASATAYASAAGMRSVILLPHGTPEIYGQMTQAYGGTAVLTDWHGRAGLLAHPVQTGWFPSKSALPTPISNPFGLQGYKSITFEIAIEMWPRLPDYVLVPIGSGDGIYGIFKGFREFRELAIIDRIITSAWWQRRQPWRPRSAKASAPTIRCARCAVRLALPPRRPMPKSWRRCACSRPLASPPNPRPACLSRPRGGWSLKGGLPATPRWS
jgi:threonine synthase